MSASTTPVEPPVNWDAGHARSQIRTWAIAIVFAVVGRAFIAESRWIPSESMVPALAVGDRLVVEKLSAHFALPHRGAIVVFRSVWFQTAPSRLQRLGMADDGALVKRVIGLPGDTVAVRAGHVWLNGRPLAEPYAAVALQDMAVVTVPPRHVFVMGDNRNHSADSRVFGPVPADHLIGQAIWRFWPPARLGRP
jgi:signal peptidase I